MRRTPTILRQLGVVAVLLAVLLPLGAIPAGAQAPGTPTAVPVESDRDGDGAADATDTCIEVADPDQSDTDGDGSGDACDATPDGDALTPVAEDPTPSPTTAPPASPADASLETAAEGASVSIDQLGNAARVSAGESIGISIWVENTGTEEVNVRLVDSLPAAPGIAWSANMPQCTIQTGDGEQTLTCEFTLPPQGASGSAFAVDLSSPTTRESCGDYTNSASAEIVGGETVTTEFDLPIEVRCDAQASITVRAHATRVTAGQPIRFTIEVNGAVGAASRPVAVTSLLPGGQGINWSTDHPGCVVEFSGVEQILTCANLVVASGSPIRIDVTSPTTTESCGDDYRFSASGQVTAGTETWPISSNEETTEVVCPAPYATLSVTVDDLFVSRGEPIGFSAELTNLRAESLIVNDVIIPLPGGLNFGWTMDSDQSRCDMDTFEGQPAVRCEGLFTLNPGGGPGSSLSIRVTGSTTDVSCGRYAISATAVVFAEDEDVLLSSAEETIEVGCPAVTVSATAAAPAVAAGADPIGYTITVANTGDDTASHVIVTAQLPAGFTWTDDQDACAVDLANLLVCDGITLPPFGGAFHVHVTSGTDATDCGRHSTFATLSGFWTGQSKTATVEVVCGGLAVIKTAATERVPAGEPIGFNITVVNPSNQAYSVIIDDPLPVGAGLNWTTARGPCVVTPVDGVISLRCIYVMPADSPNSTTFHVTSPTTLETCGEYVNTAHTRVLGGDGETLTSEATVTVTCPEVTISTTADSAGIVAGVDRIGYTITVTNTGTDTANRVAFTDQLPTPFAWSEDQDACTIVGTLLTCDHITLAPGGGTFSVHVVTGETVIQDCGQTYENTAELSLPWTGSSTARVFANCSAVDIGITDGRIVNAGSMATLQYSVTNNGRTAFTDPSSVLTFTLITKLPNDSAQTAWSIVSETFDRTCHVTDLGGLGTHIVCYGRTLPAGESFTVTVQRPTTTADCGRSIVTSADLYIDGDRAISTGVGLVRVICPAAAMSISKTADAAIVTAGDPIGYTIIVANTSNDPATGVTFTAQLPAGFAWVTETDGCTIDEANLLTCTLDLAAGATVNVRVTSDTTTAHCGHHTSTAALGDPWSGSSEPVTVEVVCDSDGADADGPGPVTQLPATGQGPGGAGGASLAGAAASLLLLLAGWSARRGRTPAGWRRPRAA